MVAYHPRLYSRLSNYHQHYGPIFLIELCHVPQICLNMIWVIISAHRVWWCLGPKHLGGEYVDPLWESKGQLTLLGEAGDLESSYK